MFLRNVHTTGLEDTEKVTLDTVLSNRSPEEFVNGDFLDRVLIREIFDPILYNF